MPPCRLLAGLLLFFMLALFGDRRVFAEIAPQIPAEVIAAKSQLTDSQRRGISRYVEHWAQILKTATDKEAAEARDKLVDPFLLGGHPEYFIQVYSGYLSKAITGTQVLDSNRDLVRVNAMVVISYLTDKGVVSLIEKALTDRTPAVRYWAGKTVSQLGNLDKLSADDKKKLLSLISQAINNESSQSALMKLLIGIGDLNIPEAETHLLICLNERVDKHLENPNLSPDPELRAIQSFFRKLATAKTLRQDLMREGAKLIYRYMVLSATTLLERPPSDPGVVRDYERVITLADLWLPWTLKKMKPGIAAPASLNPIIEQKQISEVLLTCEEWKTILKEEPFGYKDGDLAVKKF